MTDGWRSLCKANVQHGKTVQVSFCQEISPSAFSVWSETVTFYPSGVAATDMAMALPFFHPSVPALNHPSNPAYSRPSNSVLHPPIAQNYFRCYPS